ncbi:MAG: carboxypeptidase-like regulatory domain-containing protein [Pyrinomonadaceae bacterium MAG19_C2-C3]|nr:carboxypeptidase-like regulatory domain-containing protein [Pyrinomonadaceae bacterium MAG19_C2-C3]
MRIKHFSFALLLATLFMCVATEQTATAQTVEARGKITLRAADGTETPIDKAVVTIYRTDIKGKYEVKTNKKGEYVRVGLPFGGTYIVVVSAPNARPSYQSGVRFGQIPELNFTLEAGDGRVITLEEAQAAQASAAATAPSGGGNAAPPADSAAVRKAREEEAKRVAEYEAAKAKVTATNAQLNVLLKTGNDAFNAKKYDEAVSAYDQAIAATGDFPPALTTFYGNKAVALKNRGTDKYNAALKESDAAAKEAGRNAARADLKLATEAADLSAENAKKAMSAPADAAGGGANKQSDMLNALTRRVDVYRTALLIKVPDLGDKTTTAFQEYIAAETDKAKKDKAQAEYPKVLFDSGNVKESVAAYREVLATNPNNTEAMYGLAQALSSSATDAASMKEARDAFQSFMTKANGAEYADRKKEAEATIAAFDEALKTDATPQAQPATNRRRRGN